MAHKPLLIENLIPFSAVVFNGSEAFPAQYRTQATAKVQFQVAPRVCLACDQEICHGPFGSFGLGIRDLAEAPWALRTDNVDDSVAVVTASLKIKKPQHSIDHGNI